MRIVFIGTSPFAIPTLAALAQSRHELVAIVTQPDRQQGRGLHNVAPPLKRAALEIASDVLLIQPEKIRAKDVVASIRNLKPDALIVAAFGQILPQRLLDIPPFGGINVHGSLLPRWRGAAPMQYSLIAGDPETGVTTMQMDAGLDTGDILLQRALPITNEDNLDSIERKLSLIGGELLIETLDRLENGTCPRVPQDSLLATVAPSLPNDFGTIDWKNTAVEISNLIRGVTPRPGAFAHLGGKRLKVWRAHPVESTENAEPGAVLPIGTADRKGIIVQSGGGTALMLDEVQPDNKPRMAAADWARGARVTPGTKLDAISQPRELAAA